MQLPKDPNKKLYKVSFEVSTYIYGDLNSISEEEFLLFAKKCFKHDHVVNDFNEEVDDLKSCDIEISLADGTFKYGWDNESFPYDLLETDFDVALDESVQNLEALVVLNEISKSPV